MDLSYSGWGRTTVDEFQRLAPTPTQATLQLTGEGSDLRFIGSEPIALPLGHPSVRPPGIGPEPAAYQAAALTVMLWTLWSNRDSNPEQTHCKCATLPIGVIAPWSDVDSNHDIGVYKTARANRYAIALSVRQDSNLRYHSPKLRALNQTRPHTDTG